MIENLPQYITVIFIAITLLALLMLYKASGWRGSVWIISIVWLTVQAIIAMSGFYTITNTIPPRLIGLAGPALVMIIFLFVTKKGRAFIDKFDSTTLTYLHILRIPVEIVLLLLFLNKQVPELMTFEGRNFDILSGLSAPFIAYFGYSRKKLNSKVLLTWNFICLALLFNIVINAVFSAPTLLQQFAFDQPNVGILYFPFVWLPCFVVPVVLFSHLVCIRSILKNKK